MQTILAHSIAYIFKNVKFKVLNGWLKKTDLSYNFFLKRYFVCKFKIFPQTNCINIKTYFKETHPTYTQALSKEIVNNNFPLPYW